MHSIQLLKAMHFYVMFCQNIISKLKALFCLQDLFVDIVTSLNNNQALFKEGSDGAFHLWNRFFTNTPLLIRNGRYYCCLSGKNIQLLLICLYTFMTTCAKNI